MATLNVDPVDFPIAMRRLRIKAGLTETAVATAAGVSVGSLSNYERGATPIPLPTAEAIIKTLGYTMVIRLRK